MDDWNKSAIGNCFTRHCLSYFRRGATPGPFFLTLGLRVPRGSVRFGLATAFLRAARLSFFRSSLSLMFFVFAISFLSHAMWILISKFVVTNRSAKKRFTARRMVNHREGHICWRELRTRFLGDSPGAMKQRIVDGVTPAAKRTICAPLARNYPSPSCFFPRIPRHLSAISCICVQIEGTISRCFVCFHRHSRVDLHI